VRSALPASLLVAAALLALQPQGTASAGLLDRIKRKAEEATESVRELNNEIESVEQADDRAEAQAAAAVNEVERDIDAGTDLEGRSRDAVSQSDVAADARAAARQANRVEADLDRAATTDERAQAQGEQRLGRVEREAQTALDLEGRTRSEIRSSEAAGAVTRTERDIDNAAHIDERAEDEARSRARQARRDSGLGASERSVAETRRAVEELGAELD
jgi:hypothetical protein